MPQKQPIKDSTVQEILKTAQSEARSRIKVGQIIDRMGKIHRGEIVADAAVLNAQIRAGEVLLRKALPDLSSVEMSGPEGGPLTITINKVA